jgi:hypothetical protein
MVPRNGQPPDPALPVVVFMGLLSATILAGVARHMWRLTMRRT